MRLDQRLKPRLLSGWSVLCLMHEPSAKLVG